MKKSLAALLAVLLIFGCAALTACSKKRLSTEAGDSQIISADEIADTMTSKDGKYEIAMVTNVGRLKDKSFNQGTWDGVKLVNSMKSGGTLEVKNDFSAFLAGGETFENVAVSFVK